MSTLTLAASWIERAMPKEITVLHEGSSYIYIHNDLQTAAFYLKEKIEEKIQNGDRSGIGYDKMACLAMLAFSVEANINFFGHKLISGWRERASFETKFSAVLARLNIVHDDTQRPFKSLKALKEFRDLIAHGKPKEIQFNETLVMSPEEADRANDLSADWEAYCSDENVMFSYEDVEIVWKMMLKTSGLKLYDTLTRGDRSIKIVP